MREQKEPSLVTPGEVLGRASDVKAGRGACVAPHNSTVYSSLTGFLRTISLPADYPDQTNIPNIGVSVNVIDACNIKRPIVEVTGHKAQGAVPVPGSVVIGQITKVMARMASADIMCVGPKSVREKFTGIIRQQDVRATEIDKVDMHLSFHPGDIVRALVVQLWFQ